MIKQQELSSPLPESCTDMSVNCAGVACMMLTLAAIRWFPNVKQLTANLIVIAAYAFPVIVLEWIYLKTYRRPSAGIDFSIKSPWQFGRAGIKLIGFYATVFLVFSAYWLFPEYALLLYPKPSNFYYPYWEMLRFILPWLLIGAIPYFVITDHYMTNPYDGYWQMGSLILLRYDSAGTDKLAQHLLGWLVKAFFLALMFVYMSQDIDFFRKMNIKASFSGFKAFFNLCQHCLFTIDVTIAAAGYLLTLRLFDSHIRTAEPTLSGWLSALLCYQPFNMLLHNLYFAYDKNGYVWDNWLAGHQVLYILWGSIILILTGIYVWATVAFGIRFSNVTHRGILTNGPYRFCKHPAYMSKNLSWWFISIPFISDGGPLNSLRYCLLLFLFNIVYFIRARTEERHLSRDPIYVEYAMKMNRQSIFAKLGDLFPFLKYKPDAVPVSVAMPDVSYD